MICKECGSERKENDFLGKDTCYKCQYNAKIGDLKPSQIRLCGYCGNRFLKSSRWIYCSGECQKLAENQQKKEYWTNHMTKN